MSASCAGPTVRAPTPPRRCAWNWSSWFSSLADDGEPRVERLTARERETLPARAAGRPAWLLHRRKRVPGTLGVGAGAVPRGPYAEDRVLAIDMLRAGYAKAYVPGGGGVALPRLHGVAAAASLLRRVARAARGLRLARARGARIRCSRQLRGELGRTRRELVAPRTYLCRARWATLAAVEPPQCRAPARRAAGVAGRSAARCGAAPAVARAPRGLRGARFRSARRPTPSTGSRPVTDGQPVNDEHDSKDSRQAIARAGGDRRERAGRDVQRPAGGPAPADLPDLRYHGWRTLLFRVITFPLRFTPLKRRLRLRSNPDDDAYRRALDWYREHGGPSTS